jgi:hypothetical protein
MRGKEKANSEEVWTADDEVVYRPLRRKKLRIEARLRKDLGGRFKRYGARKRKSPPDA